MCTTSLTLLYPMCVCVCVQRPCYELQHHSKAMFVRVDGSSCTVRHVIAILQAVWLASGRRDGGRMGWCSKCALRVGSRYWGGL